MLPQEYADYKRKKLRDDLFYIFGLIDALSEAEKRRLAEFIKPYSKSLYDCILGMLPE